MRDEPSLFGFICCQTNESSFPFPDTIGYANEDDCDDFERIVSSHNAPVFFDRYTFSTPLLVSNQSMFTSPSKVKRIGLFAFPAEVICSGVAATFPSGVILLTHIEAFSELYHVRSHAR